VLAVIVPKRRFCLASQGITTAAASKIPIPLDSAALHDTQ
jgi:hypothetical protein